MNIRTLPPLTPDEFLHHPALQNERCELSEGRIVMMTGASKAHREIASNLFVVLHAALDRRRYHRGDDRAGDPGRPIGPLSRRGGRRAKPTPRPSPPPPRC